MTPKEVNAFLSKQKWRFAKTMPKNPHEYIVRDRSDDAEFIEAVKTMRTHGEARPFWGKIYVYYKYEGFEYWTMGNSLEITKIINRAKI